LRQDCGQPPRREFPTFARRDGVPPPLAPLNIMLYRHSRLAFAGSLHFVTTVASTRGNWFVDEATCRTILEVFEYYRAKSGVTCYGYALMPDHVHALLQQEEEGMGVASLMESFKRLTTKKVLAAFGIHWRSPYDDVPVPGSEAAKTKLVYMHNNPLRRGLAARPEDYLWSSARDFAGQPLGIVTVTTQI